MPAFLIVVALVLVLPIALAVGGHNGATAAGVVIVLLAILLHILTTPARKDPS